MMNRAMQNRLSMYRGAIQVLDRNRSVWESIPGIVNHVEKFQLLLEDLKQTRESLELSTKPVTSAKKRSMDETSKLAITLRAALVSVAKQDGNTELEDGIPGNLRDIRYGAVSRRIFLIQKFIALGDAHLESLAAMGWTAEKQEQLKQSWEKSNAITDAPRNRISEFKLIRKKISELSASIMDLLEKGLDSAILVIKSEQPDFYSEWEESRLIVDARTTSRKERVQEDESAPTVDNPTATGRTGQEEGSDLDSPASEESQEEED